MCGKGGGKFYDYMIFGSRGAFAQIGSWGEGIFSSAGVDTSGWKGRTTDLTAQAWNQRTDAEIAADAQRRQAFLLRKADTAARTNADPTKSAGAINPASEIANRRRKALLDARRSLTPQSGLGANAPLY